VVLVLGADEALIQQHKNVSPSSDGCAGNLYEPCRLAWRRHVWPHIVAATPTLKRERLGSWPVSGLISAPSCECNKILKVGNDV
jgi:hypothetical protein